MGKKAGREKKGEREKYMLRKSGEFSG